MKLKITQALHQMLHDNDIDSVTKLDFEFTTSDSKVVKAKLQNNGEFTITESMNPEDTVDTQVYRSRTSGYLELD